MENTIAFNRPHTTGREIELIADAIARGHFSGDGFYTRRASELIESLTSTSRSLLTTSCTHALELRGAAARPRAGRRGDLPVVHVRLDRQRLRAARRQARVRRHPRDTLNLDETLIEAAITPRTRAILAGPLRGRRAARWTRSSAIAAAHDLAVVEDAAQGCSATLPRPAARLDRRPRRRFSFHETKNFICGEGGALLVNDPSSRERAEIIREKGTNRAQFFRGEVDKYTWVDVGSSYLPARAARRLPVRAARRRDDDPGERGMAIWRALRGAAAPSGPATGLRLPVVPADSRATGPPVLPPDADVAERERFIEHMAAGGIKAVFHYVPLHSAPAGRPYAAGQQLPVTDRVSDGLVRLPVYPDLTTGDVDRVIERVLQFTS